MPAIHETRPEFGDGNAALQLLLGLVSLTDGLARLLPGPAQGPPDGPGPQADSLVAALLGVVSLRERLAELCPPAPEAKAPEAESAAPAELRTLLR